MKRTSGFSLVELSIVLVIIGLLVGGVLAGKSLIRASELRSVATAFNTYRTAMYAFKDKYFALPGDIRNATSFWGTGATCPTDTTGGTCNGDGDNRINCAASYTGCEWTYSTQHLAKAGLIEGSYNPNWPLTASPLLSDYVFMTKMTNVGLAAYFRLPYPTVYYDNYGNKNYIRAAKWLTSAYYDSYATTVFSCEDAWNIDSKMDDGKPGMGKIIGPRTVCTTDTTSANYATAEYNLSNTSSLTYLEYEFQ